MYPPKPDRQRRDHQSMLPEKTEPIPAQIVQAFHVERRSWNHLPYVSIVISVRED